MAYGTYFTSINPVRRRMAAAAESVSPGFPAIISAVDEAKRTVDVWMQGSAYTLKDVPYSSQLRNKPEHIGVGQVVYIRYAYGNKFRVEVAGPSLAFPSYNPEDGAPPEPPDSDPDMVVSGLVVRESATPGMTVAITTGRAHLNGENYDFGSPLVGEDISGRITGATISTLIVGAGATLDSTYCYIPISPADLSYSRYDNVELGVSDQVIDYIVGTPSINPAPMIVQSGHLLLGTVLVRPNATVIYATDINAFIYTGYLVDSVPSLSETTVGGFDTLYFVVSVKDASGVFVSAHPITCTLTGNGGTVAPLSAETNEAGYCIFSFTRDVAPTQSCRLAFRSGISVAYDESTVVIYDANGVPFPFA